MSNQAARSPLACLAAAIVAIALTSGCRHGTRVETGTRAGILQFANNTEPSDLDPNTNIDGHVDCILTSLFEGLVGLSNDGRTVIPGVAESWDVSPDAQVLNGQPLEMIYQNGPNAFWSGTA